MKAPMVLAFAGLSIWAAHAAEATATVALICHGTSTSVGDDHDHQAAPEPISRAIVVNWKDRTVTGFSLPGNITEFDELRISFLGFHNDSKVGGSINRVTGEANIYERDGAVRGTDYRLKCTPTQRMF